MPAGPELKFSGICIRCMCFCVEFQTVVVHRNAFNVCARLQAYVCILAVIHLFIKCMHAYHMHNIHMQGSLYLYQSQLYKHVTDLIQVIKMP